MMTGIVERASKLAPECATIDEIRLKLKREGYSEVENHLQGSSIQKDLKRLLKQKP
jgi:hypothetical protein